jgi:hypothetical protein
MEKPLNESAANSDRKPQTNYGWMPHNASFGFLDIASATLGVFASLDRF